MQPRCNFRNQNRKAGRNARLVFACCNGLFAGEPPGTRTPNPLIKSSQGGTSTVVQIRPFHRKTGDSSSTLIRRKWSSTARLVVKLVVKNAQDFFSVRGAEKLLHLNSNTEVSKTKWLTHIECVALRTVAHGRN
jgi:hypothetical protein